MGQLLYYCLFFSRHENLFFRHENLFSRHEKIWIISWKKSATCGAIFCVFCVFCVRPPHADFARLCAFAWEIFAHRSTEIHRILLRMFLRKSVPSAWDHNAPQGILCPVDFVWNNLSQVASFGVSSIKLGSWSSGDVQNFGNALWKRMKVLILLLKTQVGVIFLTAKVLEYLP